MLLLLDPDFVRKNPGVVELHTESLKLMVTEKIKQELGASPDGRIKEALLRGSRLKHIGALSPPGKKYRARLRSYNSLAPETADFLSSAFRIMENDKPRGAWIITGTPEAAEVALKFEMPYGRRCSYARDLSHLREEVEHAPLVPTQPLPPPVDPLRFFSQELLYGLIAVLIVLGTWRFAAKNQHLVVGWLSYSWLGPVTLFAGVLLFLFRAHFRFSYGMLEIVVGMAINVMNGTAPAATPSASLGFWTILRISTGLYVVVRGFDNIDKSMEDAGTTPRWWERVGRSKKKNRRLAASAAGSTLPTT